MMPLEIGWNATVSWQAGDTVCRVMAFFRIFGLFLSGNILICISLDRYFAVLKPLGIPDANSRGRLMLTIAWLASFACSLPQAYIFHVEIHPEHRWYEQCVTFNSFPGPRAELAYNFFGFFFLYVLPLLTIIFCYARILIEIYRVNRQKHNEDGLRRSNMGALGRAKIRTLKMTIIIVAVFFFCWTPYNIMSLWYWFDKDTAKEVDQRIQKGLFLFACTNSCVNPLIYGLFHFRARQKSNSAPRSQPQGSRPPVVPSENYKMRVRWNPNHCCVMECGSSGSSGDAPAMSSSPGQTRNHVHVRPTQQIWTRNSTRNCCISDQQPTRRDITVANSHGRQFSNSRQNRSQSSSNHSGHRRCSTFQMYELDNLGVRATTSRSEQSSPRQHYIDDRAGRRRSCLSSVL
ncbi:Gonadotropin-releasing hormone II receptor [Orchesella cincta]|uniref:Gonadotropin-releasing hormone II receptor n=1 Tax=Orchesella cincta TaxID=48709 RepID=A0A1D2MWW8_ORCCI|nr:Gonadotropin-releasing hormone II receptor [Orchesella cincta]